jgi:putative peptidoglycan lipid II flippase
MLPATLGLAATQINIFVDTWLASRYGHGPMTYLQLAFRLMQLPLGLFGVAIGTANLVRVSRGEAQRDPLVLRGHLATALRYAAILTLPATFGLIALREPIVRLLFEHGAFDAQATDRTAAVVLCYSLGLFAYSATKIQIPMFYALGDTRTPLISSAAAVGVKIAANFGLIAALGVFGIDPYLGLALSTSLAAWVNFGSLAFYMRKTIGSLSSEHRVFVPWLACLGVSILMALSCRVVHAALERWVGGGGLPGEAFRLFLAITVGLAFLLLTRRWSGWDELRRGLRRDTA